MRKISAFCKRLLVLAIWFLPTLSFCQNALDSEQAIPWYLWIPLAIFGFLFNCIFRLLFSFWGWIIILFIILPLLKDRLWLMNRKGAFLRSQKSALINPQDADARYQLGMIYFKGRSYSRAEDYFRQAVSIDNDHSEYHFALARVLYKRKKYQDAITTFQEALKLQETAGYGDIQLGLGNCYLKLNNLQEAKNWLEKAIEKNSSLAETYYKLALVCHQLGDTENQKIMINECRRIASDSPPFLRSRNRKWGFYASIYPVSSLFV